MWKGPCAIIEQSAPTRKIRYVLVRQQYYNLIFICIK